MERRMVVLEAHPNSGGMWVGKLGTESEVMEYLREQAERDTLDYVLSVIELREGAVVETENWLDFEECEPIAVNARRVQARIVGNGQGTPPLPGLERRLQGVESNAYGVKKSTLAILEVMTDEEITLAFDEVLQDLLQEGRQIR